MTHCPSKSTNLYGDAQRVIRVVILDMGHFRSKYDFTCVNFIDDDEDDRIFPFSNLLDQTGSKHKNIPGIHNGLN
jgi:hypothetical protein